MINSVIHSQLYYLPPKKDLDEIRKLSFQFLWDGKREVITRQSIETSKEYGGLGQTQKCKAFHFRCNVQKPSMERALIIRQRSSLFKYFFAFYIRGVYSHVFSNSQAHFFLD